MRIPNKCASLLEERRGMLGEDLVECTRDGRMMYK